MLFVPCIHNFKINRLIRTEQRDGPQIRTQLVLRMALLFFFFLAKGAEILVFCPFFTACIANTTGSAVPYLETLLPFSR